MSVNAEDHKQLPEERQKQKWVKGRMDRSANIDQKNHYQTETALGPGIPEYDSDK